MSANSKIPANQGLQQYSTGINKKYDAPVFKDLAILADTQKYPVTQTAHPTEARVSDAKDWVDENEL